MKKFLLLALLLFPTISEAQTSRNPCYTTDNSNCIGVGSSTPLPTTNSLSSTSAVTSVTTNTYSYTSDKDRELVFVHAEYTSSATVGNRSITLELLNAADTVIGDWHVTPTQAASLVRHYEFMQGTYREATFDAAGTVQTPFPIGLVVPIGYKIRIRDTNNISATDTMDIGYQLK